MARVFGRTKQAMTSHGLRLAASYHERIATSESLLVLVIILSSYSFKPASGLCAAPLDCLLALPSGEHLPPSTTCQPAQSSPVSHTAPPTGCPWSGHALSLTSHVLNPPRRPLNSDMKASCPVSCHSFEHAHFTPSYMTGGCSIIISNSAPALCYSPLFVLPYVVALPKPETSLNSVHQN